MHDDFAFLSFFRLAMISFMAFNLFYGRFSHEVISVLRNALYLDDFALKLRHKRDEKEFQMRFNASKAMWNRLKRIHFNEELMELLEVSMMRFSVIHLLMGRD